MSKNSPQILIRMARVTDIPFLVDGIIESDRTGGEEITLTNLLQISEKNLKKLLGDILINSYNGHELSLGSFCVAEIDGRVVGQLSSWVEPYNKLGSSTIKMALLNDAMENFKFDFKISNFSRFKSLSIERKKGALQLEYIYVGSEFRKLGVFRKMFNYAVYDSQKKFTMAEVILNGLNKPALNAYKSLGFKVSTIKSCPIIFDKHNKNLMHQRISMQNNFLEKK